MESVSCGDFKFTSLDMKLFDKLIYYSFVPMYVTGLFTVRNNFVRLENNCYTVIVSNHCIAIIFLDEIIKIIVFVIMRSINIVSSCHKNIV